MKIHLTKSASWFKNFDSKIINPGPNRKCYCSHLISAKFSILDFPHVNAQFLLAQIVTRSEKLTTRRMLGWDEINKRRKERERKRKKAARNKRRKKKLFFLFSSFPQLFPREQPTFPSVDEVLKKLFPHSMDVALFALLFVHMYRKVLDGRDTRLCAEYRHLLLAYNLIYHVTSIWANAILQKREPFSFLIAQPCYLESFVSLCTRQKPRNYWMRCFWFVENMHGTRYACAYYLYTSPMAVATPVCGIAAWILFSRMKLEEKIGDILLLLKPAFKPLSFSKFFKYV